MVLLLQSPLAGQSNKEKNVRVKVDLVSLGENISGLYLGKSQGKKVSALAFRYSQTIKYNGDRVIQISKGSESAIVNDVAISKEDKEDTSQPFIRRRSANIKPDESDKYQLQIEELREKNPSLVALATVPAGSRHVTILLTAAMNDTYRTLVFDDDPRSMAYGNMRIHNFCDHSIGMKFVGGKPAVIKAKSSYLVKPGAGNLVKYLLSYPKKDKWKAQESNLMRVTPDQQVRMIVLNSKSSFFQSSSGTRGGHLQVAFLTRDKTVKANEVEASN